ncbi:CPBP family intramembrane glutamic endopeptidase [Thermus filiformis]|uniref:Abortive phage infection protein n=1 Tax=Thermus filiformis TaxID=276 RepID=A0A0A2WUG5_THEFI|nr:CPBP family intramembrane glutamic endopeptidase [Thermus filiformis]KGQ22417.1 abortive phage infection protein [Thermus filiformis]
MKESSLQRALFWTYALSWGLFGLYLLLGGRLGTPGFALFAVAYMWTPGLVALYFAGREGVRLPLALRPNRYWLLAWLLPVGLTLLSIPLSLPFGRWRGLQDLLAAIPNAQSLPEALWWGVLLLQGLLAGATVNLLAALGEELMWRGYLWERLKERGFWPASLDIGLVWGLWHAPLVLLGYNYPQHPLAGVGMMTFFTLLLTPALLYVREKGGSLLAAALLHGTLNAVAGLSLLAVERTNDLLVGVLGLPGLFLLAAFNLYLRRRGV